MPTTMSRRSCAEWEFCFPISDFGPWSCKLFPASTAYESQTNNAYCQFFKCATVSDSQPLEQLKTDRLAKKVDGTVGKAYVLHRSGWHETMGVRLSPPVVHTPL